MNVVELFELVARTNWRMIETSRRNRIAMGEEAITSINMNALSSAYVGVMVEDQRVAPSARACHFELWIGTELRGWSRYAVLAKKIGSNASTYSTLTRKVQGRRQIDALAEYAAANRAAALYCFYNHSAESGEWNCNLLPEMEQLGSSVTPVETVRAALDTPGGRSFSWIHSRPETIPWRCLVRCPLLVGPDDEIAHTGWPARSAYRHAQLPESLQTLQKLRHERALTDAFDLYSRESALRPAWVGVFDLERR